MKHENCFLTRMVSVIMLLLCCALSEVYPQVSVWDGAIADEFGAGNGSIDNPYKITEASQLALLAYRVNNGFGAGAGNVTDTSTFYRLMVDIDLSRILWTPIGNGDDGALFSFGGFFDGNNHKISNLNVEKVTENQLALGFFGYCNGATIINLTINENSSVISTPAPTGGYTSGYDYLGSIVGFGKNVTIYNCHSNAFISSSAVRGNCGGIIGITCNNNTGFSIISNCSNSGTLSSSNDNISGYENYVGGIIGKLETFVRQNPGSYYGVYIVNCYNTGAVSAVSHDSYAGGIAGSSNVGDFSLINCYNAGTVHVSANSNQSGGGGVIGPFTNYGQSNILNTYFLVTCGSNVWDDWGIPRTEAFMKSEEFVDLINNGSFTFCKDNFPYVNDGYPVFTGFEISTLETSGISQSKVLLQGYVKPGNQLIISRGFQIKESTSSSYMSIGVNTSSYEYSFLLDSLSCQTLYMVRTYAVNTLNDTVFGLDEMFETLPVFFQADDAFDITQTSANVKVIFRLGDAVCFAKGLDYKAEDELVYKIIQFNSEADSIVCPIDNLLPGKKYQYRVFYQGKDSTFLGEEMHFTTLPHSGLGISELNSKTNLIIYPNPATEYIYLTHETSFPVLYAVLNEKGQSLMKGNLLNESDRINIEALPNGFYFLSIVGKDQVIKPFIKQ